MQIITDINEARAFAQNLAQSLTDTAYWRNWSFLHIAASPSLDWIKQAKITALLRAQIPDGDGNLIWLEGAVAVIFIPEKSFDLNAFSQTLAKALAGTTPMVEMLSIEQYPAKVQALLTQNKSREPVPQATPAASYKLLKSLVPNIEELFHEWHKEKQTKTERAVPHIMVVDDDPLTLRLVRQTLEKDYPVITAQNGAEAIAKHLQNMPDIIFLDIGLPDCDGLTLLNYMQQYDKDCRIVMFSADDFLKTRVKAFAGGAKGFLPKPFNLQGFKRHINAWMTGKNGGGGENT